MASPATAISAQLLSAPTITALVGSRVYVSVARIADQTYPLIVYKVSDVSTTQTYGGTDGFTTCKLEIACIGLTYSSVDALAWAVVALLDGSQGTWGGVVVQGVFLDEDGVSDDDVQETQSEALTDYVKTCTFTMLFNQ